MKLLKTTNFNILKTKSNKLDNKVPDATTLIYKQTKYRGKN